MTVKPRTMIAAAALTVTGSLSVAALLVGGSAAATAAPTAPAAVAAEVQAAPAVVVPAKAAVVVKTVHAVHVVAPVRHTVVAAKVVRHVTVAVPVTKPAAIVAPKPAPKPVAAPAPAPAPKPAPAPATSTTSTRDDYPFRTATTNDSDTWGFTKRQCVSFAAFRLSQHGHAIDNGTQNWGSALSWDDAAKRLGKTVTTSPRVGAIAQWNAGESSSIFSSTGAKKGSFSAGGYGHVGYVAAVYGDGSVLVEQYNLGGDRSYSAMRMSAPRYIVF